MLREVGFWCSPGDDSDDVDDATRSPLLASRTITNEAGNSDRRPDPHELVDHRWYLMNTKLIAMLEWYLLDGAFVESHELAYSHCRFRRCVASKAEPKVMGACTLTDGVFIWPEGYWHYIRQHHVRPPQDFLDHVLANYRRAVLAASALTREFGDTTLWLWEPLQRRPVPMPGAMQAWVLAHTTLTTAATRNKPPPRDGPRRPWNAIISENLPGNSCCGCHIS